MPGVPLPFGRLGPQLARGAPPVARRATAHTPATIAARGADGFRNLVASSRFRSRAASSRLRSRAASGGVRLRRRGATAGARSDRQTKTDRAAAAHADAPAAGHGLHAGEVCRTRQGSGLAEGAASHRGRRRTMSGRSRRGVRHIQQGTTRSGHRQPHRAQGGSLAHGGLADRIMNRCRETPSASNVSSMRRRVRSSRSSPTRDGTPASTGRGRLRTRGAVRHQTMPTRRRSRWSSAPRSRCGCEAGRRRCSCPTR